MNRLLLKEASKLMDLGRRLLQTVDRCYLSAADVLGEPTPLTPEERAVATQIATTAADRIALWYPEVSAELGTYLLDPNVVLTIGDARGQTEFTAPTSTDEVKRLNTLSSKVGIEFSVGQTSETKRGLEAFIGMTSRRGLELATANSKLPGVPKYLAKSGEDPWLWFHHVQAGLGSNFSGSSTDESIVHIAIGVMKGYPDKAIVALKSVDRQFWKGTRMKCGNYYDCAQPNYIFDRRDAEGVHAQANIWGEALSQFYKSPEHLKIKSQPSFVLERLKNIDKALELNLKLNEDALAFIEPEHIEIGPHERLHVEEQAWRQMYASLLVRAGK